MTRARERPEARGVKDPSPADLAVALPILHAAADESRDELQDLYARLLAAAMDPNRASQVRRSLVEFVNQLDPMDASVLHRLVIDPPAAGAGTGDLAEGVARALGVSREEAFFSLERLHHLGALSENPSSFPRPRVASKCLLLIRAVSD